jgi:hypothetical protein
MTIVLIPHLVILLSAVIKRQLLPTVMLQFYIKLSGKKCNAADSLEQLVCSDTKTVGTLCCFYLLWYVLNIV